MSEIEHPEPVVVATYADRGEAEVVRAKLAGAGIDAAVIDEVEGGTVPVDGELGVRVVVPADQATTAAGVLDAP